MSQIQMPSNWEQIKLGDLLRYIGNGLTANQNKDGLGYPVTRIETISADSIDETKIGFVAEVSNAEIEKYRLQSGDILISHINSEPQIGRSVVYQGKPELLLHGMNLLLLRPDKTKVVPAFLDYVLKIYRIWGKFIAIASRAVGQSSINQGKLKSLEIFLPPLPQQRAISHTLRAVQEAREARRKELQLERERKAALMQHLFTHGTRGEELKQTEIGEMPESWQVVAIEETGRIVTGSTPKTSIQEYYGGSYMFVSPGDIGESKFVSKTQKYLSSKGLEVSRTIPRNSVFVVCIGATIGKTAMAFDEVCATNQQINSVIPNNSVSPDFLYYSITFRSTDLPSLAGRAAVPIVNKSNFAKFSIALPSDIKEQIAIAETLSACDSKIETLEQEAAILDELFRAMLEELMTGKLSAVPLVEQE